jgi:crotonobetainyl-CoA:carnitine CoA-transferase CaiB-like acyl-CoA transferase
MRIVALEQYGSSGPIQGVPEALRDPHTIARAVLAETEHPHHGTVRQPVTPVRVGDHPTAVALSPGPAQRADAPYVLKELLDYDDNRIDALRSQGAFG